MASCDSDGDPRSRFSQAAADVREVYVSCQQGTAREISCKRLDLMQEEARGSSLPAAVPQHPPQQLKGDSQDPIRLPYLSI